MAVRKANLTSSYVMSSSTCLDHIVGIHLPRINFVDRDINLCLKGFHELFINTYTIVQVH